MLSQSLPTHVSGTRLLSNTDGSTLQAEDYFSVNLSEKPTSAL